jgi:hypothetical protein
MARTLEAQVDRFFDGLHTHEETRALVFTTFGLDEMVLFELLRKYRIHRDTRIVVFHDVMKHRHPGYLFAHFPRSQVVSVELEGTSRKHRCPIFHSKIWMELRKAPSVHCARLAVHSFNLTRYHLDERRRTFEAFALWRDLQIALPKGPLFDPREIFARACVKHRRLDLKPATVLIDLLARETPRLEVLDEAVGRCLGRIGIPARGCAGPFVGLNALRFVASLGTRENLSAEPAMGVLKKLDAWTGDRRDGTCLHAKVIDFGHYCGFGSANITTQAFGIGHRRAINHEAFVLAHRPGRFRLAKMMRGFHRLTPGDLNAGSAEPVGDVDPEDDENWVEQRRRATRGPRWVELRLQRKVLSAEIHLLGSLDCIDTLVLRAEGQKPLRVAPARRLRFRRDKQRSLARLVTTGRVEVRGLQNGQEIWFRELDLGDFWPWLARHSGRSFRVNGTPSEQESDAHGRGPKFMDVRDARREAYEAHEVNPRVNRWHLWLQH